MAAPGDAYRAAGVDLEAQERGLREVGKLARETWSERVLSDIGSFGGMFQLEPIDGVRPVLVASADGVGTKLTVARMAGDFTTVGRDLVNHCVYDILVQGARPLFFLDYVGAGVLEPAQLVSLVGGVAAGCRDNGCVLLGGETAEMPGFYAPGDYELVGFIVGLVDRSAILDGKAVTAGDLLVALPSAGLHTNGYSLARRVLFERHGLALGDPLPLAGTTAGTTVGEALLAPHLSYLKPLSGLLGHPALHALAHITGGGITDNLPRVLPAGTFALVRVGAWPVLPIFVRLAELGQIDAEEMLRVFNLGVGMILVVARDGLAGVLEHLRGAGQKAYVVGTVEASSSASGVVYDFASAGGEERGESGD